MRLVNKIRANKIFLDQQQTRGLIGVICLAYGAWCLSWCFPLALGDYVFLLRRIITAQAFPLVSQKNFLRAFLFGWITKESAIKCLVAIQHCVRSSTLARC